MSMVGSCSKIRLLSMSFMPHPPACWLMCRYTYPLTTIIDPGTGKPWASVPTCTSADVDSTVQSAHAAFLTYRKVNPRVRGQLLMKWDTLIREHKEDLAQILTHETGKPLAEARGEIDYSVGFTWWFAGEAERVRGTVAQPSTGNRRVFTVKQPIGVAAALVPWNFPVA